MKKSINMFNLQNSSRFNRSSRSFLIFFIHDNVNQTTANVNLFSKDLDRLTQKNCHSLTNMIQKMQNYVIAQRVELNEITDIVTKIQKKRNVVVIERDVIIIERDEIIQKWNDVKAIIRFLQNNLLKQQQNQSSID